MLLLSVGRYVRPQRSATQKSALPRTQPTMLAPWSCISRLQNWERESSILYASPSLWYSTIATQSKTVITPVGKREHPRKCSLLNYPSSSSPRLRPRPPWKRHNHDLFLMAKHLLWWCVGATSWKTLLWNFLETCPLGFQEKLPSGRCCSSEFVMNQTKGLPGEAPWGH